MFIVIFKIFIFLFKISYLHIAIYYRLVIISLLYLDTRR